MAGTVYFIQYGNDRPIKIGYSQNDHWRRLYRMQTGAPETLHMRGFIVARGTFDDMSTFDISTIAASGSCRANISWPTSGLTPNWIDLRFL
jgi:hypothetical protein